MKKCVVILVFFAWLLPMTAAAIETHADSDEKGDPVDKLDRPLYNPFVERYVLDELKALRMDMSNQRVEFVQLVTDRQIDAVDKSVSFATSTITYFFYVIAAISSVLVIIGWKSIRDIKEKMNVLANEELAKVIMVYENRLKEIEQELNKKSSYIDENRLAIEKTQEIHALWLRAAQEVSPANKIAIYDQILSINPRDCEALTYKADAALETNEPQWAINLCQRALHLDSSNAHAFYQLACAHACLSHVDEALLYLKKALEKGDARLEDFAKDPALKSLHSLPGFDQLLNEKSSKK